MTSLEIRQLIAATNPAALRVRCGISGNTIARTLGVSRTQIYRWETRQTHPTGDAGNRYARIITGLAEHDRISRLVNEHNTEGIPS